MKKRIISLLALTLACLVLFTACASNAATSDPAQTTSEAQTAEAKTKLVAASYSDPKTLNPWSSDGRNLNRICMNIFQRLVDRNETNDDYVGVLAESWEETSEGITFHLRQNVKFHDGQTMTADDVVYSLQKGSSYAGVNFGWDWIDFDNVTAIDENTVYVPYLYPCGLTLAEFAANNMYILCKETCEQYGDEISLHPNGTAPFKVTDWVQGDYCTLSRFDDYWGEAPKLEEIKFRFISENSQAIIELETGGVDIVLDVSPLEVQNIESNDNLEIYYGNNVVCDLVHMNCESEYFSDVRVRQAVAYAMSLEDIFMGNYRGWGDMAYSVIAPSVVGYTDEFEGENYPYSTTSNIEKAKELLAEAGYPNGFTVELTIDDDSNRTAVAEILKNNLEKAGIILNIESSDYATFSQKIYSGVAEIYLNGVNANSMEPDSALFQRWHSSNIGDGGSNYTRFSDEEFDTCLNDARALPTLNERLGLYQRAQEILMEQVPSVAYFVRQAAAAKVKNLSGLRSYAGETWLAGCYFE